MLYNTYDNTQITPTLMSLAVAGKAIVNDQPVNLWHVHCSQCGDVSRVAETALATLTVCPSPTH